MSVSRAFICRQLSNIAPEPEICGDIRGLITALDEAVADVYYVDIKDAELHFHEKTDEFYYILDGRGKMFLDQEIIDVEKGTIIYIRRGTRHRAEASTGGRLVALVIAVPSGLMEDIHVVGK